jgi:hydroxymethylpyrimidine pyrophosphatase-like HAD family hydrolase
MHAAAAGGAAREPARRVTRVLAADERWGVLPVCAVQVLPLGGSKGAGVAWLLDHLGVDPRHVMALGDG